RSRVLVLGADGLIGSPPRRGVIGSCGLDHVVAHQRDDGVDAVRGSGHGRIDREADTHDRDVEAVCAVLNTLHDVSWLAFTRPGTCSPVNALRIRALTSPASLSLRSCRPRPEAARTR